MTHPRLGLACVFALVCAIGFALPAAAPAGEQIADPYFKDQWALENGSKPDIDIVQAWQVSEGAGVTVAVVDQDVDAEHPDLIGGIAPAGRDFTAPGGCSITEPTGVEDHGTYIAGLIAARRENGVAIAGVAPEATILPLRAVDNCGESNADWIGNALTHAGEAGVPIVIAAFGTDPGQLTPGDAADYNALFLDIFSRFSNTLFVVPAGNEGNDNDALPVYPCSTADPTTGESPPNLICVGATNDTDFPMCYGNVGGRSVDLFAPGSRIISTVRGKDLVQASGGTSAAAGIVAGVAALVKATDEEATPESIKFALMNSVGDPRTPGLIPLSVSGGRVNAARAVERRGNLSPNGPGGTWKTCDPDHDGLTLDADECPAQFGPAAYRGCPDSDGDGRRDISDNCPSTSNPDQADHDGDGIGTACDPTPRGEDVDGDGVPRLDDQCPTVYGTLANGCPEPLRPQPTETPRETPTPTPAPRAGVATVTVKVSRCPRGRKTCLKTAKVTVRLTSSAKASLRFEQRVKRGRKLVWRRYTVKSLNASTSARSYTLKRLKKGSYRVIVTVAGKGKTKNFTVR